MKFIQTLLAGLDTAASVTVITIVMLIFIWLAIVVIKHRKDIACALDQWAKRKQEKDEVLKMVYSNKKAIEQYAENRVHDREQSFEIQKQLTDAIMELSQKIDSMVSRQNELEEKQDKRDRAELKEKISRLYGYFHTKKEWNTMEMDVMKDLIEEYENAGGKNSFVHTTVQPEMYTWRIVEAE